MNVERHIKRNFPTAEFSSDFHDLPEGGIGDLLFEIRSKAEIPLLLIGSKGIYYAPSERFLGFEEITDFDYIDPNDIQRVKRLNDREYPTKIKFNDLIIELPYHHAARVRRLLVDYRHTLIARERGDGRSETHYCPTCELPKRNNSKSVCRYCGDRLLEGSPSAN